VESLRTEFTRELHGALARLGFKQCQTQIYTLSVSAETEGWLGIQIADAKSGGLEILPTVGFLNSRIARFYSELSSQRFDPCSPPTFTRPLAALMRAEFSYWQLSGKRDIAPAVADMCGALSGIGIPYMRRFPTLERVLRHLEMSSSDRSIGYALDENLVKVIALQLSKRDPEARVLAKAQLETWLAADGYEGHPTVEFYKALLHLQ